MRFTLLTTVVALGALACGGDKQASQTPPAGQPAATPAATGPVVEVKMTGDSIPAGAAATLTAGMPNTIDNLSGPFLMNPNDNYEVSFANAPKGTYKGYCVPHVALGMKIAITVQ